MAAGPPPRNKITKKFPAYGALRLYRLADPVDFHCHRCRTAKTSKNLATSDGDWSKPVCNACYGRERAEVRQAPTAGNPPAPATAAQLAAALGQDMARLSSLIRARIVNQPISPTESEAVDRLAHKPITAAALRYLEILTEGELQAARLSAAAEDTLARLTGLYQTLAHSRSTAVQRAEHRHARLLTEPQKPTTAPVRLDALVMRHVSGQTFRDALAAVLAQRGLRPDAIDLPLKDMWHWLASNDLDPSLNEANLPTEVHRLRRLDDRAFLQTLTDDATGLRPNGALTHPAVVERSAAFIEAVQAGTRGARDRAEQALAPTAAQHDGGEPADRIRQAYASYAHACARETQLTLLLKELKLRVVAFHRAQPLQQLRAECMSEAAAEVARNNPDLGEAVTRACAEHRTYCLLSKRPTGCYDCVGTVARLVRLPHTEATPAPAAVTAPSANTDSPQTGSGASEENRGEPSPTGAGQDDFICAAALRDLPPDQAHLVAVVEVHSQPDTSLFGYCWITEDGELRMGTDHAVGMNDSAVQGICRSIRDLADGTERVHIVSTNAAAVSLVAQVLQSGSVPETPFPLAGGTTSLLQDLAAARTGISVSADDCNRPHLGAAAAGRLAALALRAGHQLDDSRTVQAEADRVSQDFIRRTGPALTSPDEENDHAWWQVRPDNHPSTQSALTWHAALYRVHLTGGWCPLPGGPPSGPSEGQPLQLRLDHRDPLSPSAPQVQNIGLRSRGGQWELHGIRWPQRLLPGVVVTFTWRPGTPIVTASTSLLPNPERVDELEFLHRYDPQVVTREAVPGDEQDVAVPSLSGQSWVLRTLRKLGYLSPDGSATLAQDALERNCRELGMPKTMVERVSAAVDQLLRAGRIRRVRGSIDHRGRPWYPARSGHPAADLLQYLPKVQTLDPVRSRQVREAWQAMRRGHWVAGFVRRLPPSARASAEQVELHRQAVYAAEVVDQVLPEGYTYVRRHNRGRNRRRPGPLASP